MKTADDRQQNLTVRLDSKTLRKAKILAARQNTSVSRLIARYVEMLVGEDEAYERARQQALALLETGFHLGGETPTNRDSLHERQDLR